MGSSHKQKVSVAIDQDLLEWIDSEIEKKHFAGRSHAIQACVYYYMNKDQGDGQRKG